LFKKIFAFYTFYSLCFFLPLHSDVNMQVMELGIQHRDFDLPFTEVTIANQKFLLLIDTGCSATISLNERLTQKLPLIYTGNKISFYRPNGTIYHSKEIVIPEIVFGEISCQNVAGREDGKWLEETSLSKQGILGLNFLQNYHVIFDLGNNKLILSKSEETIRQLDYPLEKWTSHPFSLTNVGIVLEGEINQHPCKFVLDSGSSHTVLKRSFLTNNKITEANSVDICGTKIKNPLLLELQEPSQVDGVIGNNFFSSHKLYFNFEKNLLLIGKD